MRKKLLHFKDNAQAANLIEPGKSLYHTMKGNWHAYFGNKNSLTLELGCGKGSYTVALARRYPERNFIGVDVKGARLWAGSQEALRDELVNVAFLRADITHLDTFFAEKEIKEIYIPFPDPRPRDREEKKRLTSPRFWTMYAQLLSVGGKVHCKTDNSALFVYTREMIKESPFQEQVAIEDVHNALKENDIHRVVKTPYERRFLTEGAKIKYVRCVLDT